MDEISTYLNRVAHIETFGRSIKVDDAATTLAHKARRMGSWMTCQLSPNKFFVSCFDFQTVQSLMAEGHIQGDGFSLLVNRWNQQRGATHHRLRYKVYATLKDLPLICWSAKAVATIIYGFGIPHRASHSSLRWNDLIGFDVVFFVKMLKTSQKVLR